MITVSDWIMQRLVQEGLKHIFFLPGGGAMHLNDALARENRITPICCQHEQACGISAEAYGRTENADNPGFGVALVTTGPGATNILTPVAGAWIDSVPLLVISGQVKRADRIGSKKLRQSGVQEVDIMSMVKGITKYSATVEYPHEIQEILEKALFKMRSGRKGPVWVEIPLDIQAALFEPSSNQSIVDDELMSIPKVDYDQLEDIANLLQSSSRPLILAGHGVRLSGAANKFRELIYKWQIPVVSTWNALDLIPYDHPMYVGSPGVVALRAPNFAIQNCDLLISFGCRLDNVITAYNPDNFAKHAKKVVIDVDQNELLKLNMPLDEAVHADIADVIDHCLGSINLSPGKYSEWISQCNHWKLKYAQESVQSDREATLTTHYDFVSVISSLLPENMLIATGSSGLAIEAFYSTFRVKKGQRLFLTSGLGSMGYGLSSSIGACLGNSCSPTIALESDGSLMLNIQELATIKSLNLPIKLIVMDNSGYASIRNTQRNYFESRYIGTGIDSGLFVPDISILAKAFGLHSTIISCASTLQSELLSFLQQSGPGVCVVPLVKDEVLLPKVAALPQEDGSIISMPLEDMKPLLDIETLESEMIYPLNKASYHARGIS